MNPVAVRNGVQNVSTPQSNLVVFHADKVKLRAPCWTSHKQMTVFIHASACIISILSFAVPFPVDVICTYTNKPTSTTTQTEMY